ncbi:hypothetical protein FBU59_004551, partial [Linderina macrospora]
RYAFTISAALDSSAAFAAVLIYLIFTLSNISMPSYWGTKTDLCPLATGGGGFKNYQNFH